MTGKQLGWVVATLALAGCNGDVLSGDMGSPPTSPGSMRPMDGLDPEEAQAPPTAVEGILDCPTVDLPAFSLRESVPTTAAPEPSGTLSASFQNSCAGCHGERGQGRHPLYPAIPGDLSVEEFISAVRAGRQGMPSYAPEFIDDDALRSDFATLGQLAAQMDAAMAERQGDGFSPYLWSEERYETARRDGLVAWRTPDHHGMACASCHAPDAVDLAVIGYDDAAILRRAGLHVDAEVARDIVAYVHAQRRHFNIAKPCSPLWRPLQPGGTPIAEGQSPDAQDLAFFEYMQAEGLMIANDWIDSREKAEAAFEELANINVRTFRTAIELPRWTEDGFNGEAHVSWNDYMPVVGAIASDEDAWYALQDAYVDSPTNETFLAMLAGGKELLSYPNPAAEDLSPIDGVGGCTPGRTRLEFIPNISEPRFESVLVTQHIFRQELLNPGTWASSEPHYFGARVNPYFEFSRFSIEDICKQYGESRFHAVVETFPEEFREQTTDRFPTDYTLHNLAHEVNHSWMTLAQVYDPTFQSAERHIRNQIHYWNSKKFVQDDVHGPFLNVMRLVKQAHHREYLDGLDYSASGNRHIHPFLNGQHIHLATHLRSVNNPDREDKSHVYRVRANLISMLVHLQHKLLEEGEIAAEMNANDGHTRGLNPTWGSFVRFLESIPTARNTGVPPEIAAYFAQTLTALVEEVRQRAEATAIPGTRG